MKQTNKLRRAVSAALFCASLFLLAGVTGCSKDVVNEETPLTKATGLGSSQSNPYPAGANPFIDFHYMGSTFYFKMNDMKCSFRTKCPSTANAMVVTVYGPSRPKTFNIDMKLYPSLGLVTGGKLSFYQGSESVELRVPPIPCGPNADPNPKLPSDEVVIMIESSVDYVIGVKFSFIVDPVKPMPPYPPMGA